MKTLLPFLVILLWMACPLEAVGQYNWVKYEGNPIIRPEMDSGGADASFDRRFAWMPMVVTDGDSLLMLYDGLNDRNNWLYQIGRATSGSGLHWTKYAGNPVLTPGPPGAFDGQILWGGSVIRDGAALRMYYAGYNGSAWSIGLATSADGVLWTKHPTPVLEAGDSNSWESDGVLNASVIREADGRYLMWYSGARLPDVATGLATSSDGISWTKHPGNPVFSKGPVPDWDSYQINGAKVVRWDDLYHMFYFGGGDPSGYQIGYAISANGIDWRRYPANPVLPLGPADSWDGVSLSLNSVIVSDTAFHMWYGAKGMDELFRIGYAHSPIEPGPIEVTPATIDAGVLAVGESADVLLTVMNGRTASPVTVTNVLITGAEFSVDRTTFVIPPWSSESLKVTYAPTGTGEHRADLIITTTDSLQPELRATLYGRAFQAGVEPVIISITDVPNDWPGLVQLAWYRSVLDTAGASPAIVSYAIWRRLDSGINGGAGTETGAMTLFGDTWEHLLTVPAAHVQEYSAKVSTLCTSLDEQNRCWSVYTVSAHTASGDVYVSAPDSGYSLGYVSDVAAESGEVPDRVWLGQNYPNPFNPSTTVRYSIPVNSAVELTVHNTLGQLVRTIFSGEMGAGYHEVAFDASALAGGVYFCRLHAGGVVLTRRVVLLR